MTMGHTIGIAVSQLQSLLSFGMPIQCNQKLCQGDEDRTQTLGRTMDIDVSQCSSMSIVEQ